MAACRVLRLPVGTSIYSQLLLEESLFRARRTERSYAIFNAGYEEDVVVLGVSGDVSEVKGNIPMLRRFTGGGTVLLDAGSVTTSLVSSAGACLPSFVTRRGISPPMLMKWSCDSLFQFLNLSLKEHDYALGKRKIAGNAQAIGGNFFVHHTSFLWECDFEKLEKHLLLPKKIPEYRKNRSHTEFLTTMAERYPSKNRNEFFSDFVESLDEIFDGSVAVESSCVVKEMLDRAEQSKTKLRTKWV